MVKFLKPHRQAVLAVQVAEVDKADILPELELRGKAILAVAAAFMPVLEVAQAPPEEQVLLRG
jgi:hypothetical protein